MKRSGQMLGCDYRDRTQRDGKLFFPCMLKHRRSQGCINQKEENFWESCHHYNRKVRGRE